jgi:ABC-type transporter Mla subunit MlaD
MDFLADFSILTLCIFGIVTLLTFWFAVPGYNSHSASHAPTILTSIGIFGTFLGVALGLLEFDTNNIQASVPGLIDGLKTAFWTSIMGLLGALIVKFRHLAGILRQRKVAESYRSATVTDLANILGDIRDSLSNEKAGGLRAALVTIHQDQNKHLSEFRESMQSYEARMVKANTSALITAIKAVMRNFNTQINEQYGDNFKELNRAVGQMLEWQKNYKVELEELLSSQKSNGKLLDKASQAYEKLVAHSEVFTTVSDSLGSMLGGLQTQSRYLDNYLTQLAKVADKAAVGLPALETRVHSLTEELGKSVLNNQRQVSQLLQESVSSIETTVTTINKSLSDTLIQSQQGLHDKVEHMLSRTEQQIMKLDDAMEDELVKALKTFGYQLASLSEKFVSDYGPLTEKLQKVVAMAQSQTVGPVDEQPRERRPRIATQ